MTLRLASFVLVAALAAVVARVSAQGSATVPRTQIEQWMKELSNWGRWGKDDQDIPLLRKVAYLEPGEAVYPSDLEAWEKFAGITIGPGDAVFVRTGRAALRCRRLRRPIHLLSIVTLGLPLVDVMDLEAAAAESARRKRWEFMVTLAAPPLPGGTGFPVNPIAVY